MDHKDRAQTCIEDFEIIKKLMDQLIGCKFKDYDNSERKISINDILIVSPFNAQVNFLKSRLHKDTNVVLLINFREWKHQ